MPLSWVAAVVVLSVLRQSKGDSVTQTKGSVLISQGESVVVNCTYEAVSPSLFWYVQFPSQPPRLFLKDLGREDSDEGIRSGFDATHDKKHKSFHLRKPASDLSDSGTYYCASSDTVTQTGRDTEQKPPRGCSRTRRLLGATGSGRRRRNSASTGLSLTKPADNSLPASPSSSLRRLSLLQPRIQAMS